MSEVLDRLTEIEKRVANLKDWKQKYEEDKGNWDKEKEELLKRLKSVRVMENLREVLTEFLGLASIATGSTRETVNLNHKELVVNLGHEEKEVNLTTGTVVGKVLFCALTKLSREGFGETELSETLKEHGWNVGHTTLAPTLGSLVKDGYLVRLEGKPAKYRLPNKVKLNVRKEGR